MSILHSVNAKCHVQLIQVRPKNFSRSSRFHWVLKRRLWTFLKIQIIFLFTEFSPFAQFGEIFGIFLKNVYCPSNKISFLVVHSLQLGLESLNTNHSALWSKLPRQLTPLHTLARTEIIYP